jgi:homoserine dehydrogenase
LREGLAANRIGRVAGILNGTCNYILTVMREQRRDFAEVLAEAQRLGYAEADPAFDIDGVDAAHKLAILAALAFGRPVDFAAVHVEGIRDVSALDIALAEELGYRIKLLGIASRAEGGGVSARVHPCMVPASAPIARVDGVFNAVVAEGDFAGRLVLEGRGGADGERRRGRPDRLGARAARAGLGRGCFARRRGGADAAHGAAPRRLLSAAHGA